MINGKTVLAITLARGGSKSIFKKNIAIINDKPLLTYTINEAIKSKYIDEYIIATDDSDIEMVCRANSITCFKRAAVADTQTSAAGLLEVLKNRPVYDYVIELKWDEKHEHLLSEPQSS